MNETLFQETFSKLEASRAAKETLLATAEQEHPIGAHKPLRPLRIIAVAAAVACLLTITAFAANAATGGLLFDRMGFVILSRFERGVLVDEEGNRVDNPSLIEKGENYTVLRPDFVVGVELTLEDGRMILYLQCGTIMEKLDITDPLKSDGAFQFWKAQDVYSVTASVYAADDPENSILFEGVPYQASINGRYQDGRGRITEFTLSDTTGAFGNA